MKQDLRERQSISRRRLISAAVMAGVLSASGVSAGARRRGGVLRLGLTGTASSWEPRFSHGTFMRVAAQGAVYETLTEITAGGELVGELATEWEPTENARVWIVNLRPDVFFHDGRPLRTGDVIASLGHHRDGSSAASSLARISAIRATGALQLRFTLAAPDANFPLALADPRLVIAPEGRFDGTGTGLYQVAEFVPEERLRLVRVPSHWRDGRAGWFDAVVLRAMPDLARRRAALIAGHVDAIDHPGDGARIRAYRDLRIVTAEGHGYALTASEERAAHFAGLAPVPGAPAYRPVVAVDPAYGLPGVAGPAACYGAGVETLFADARPLNDQVTAYLPFATACTIRLCHEGLGCIGALDSGRIAERWWFA